MYEVERLFEYRDNELWWRHKPANNVDMSKPAGCITGRHGYRNIAYNKTTYPAHRLIFLYHHGWLPEAVNHKDNNRQNNNINNLRAATRSQYGSYSKKPSSNTSGHKNVGRVANKWQVMVMYKGKNTYGGQFFPST